MDRVRDTGGSLFEAVVGAPLQRYGPRLTLNAAPDPGEHAVALGFGAHPWGPPNWYGVRFDPAGAVIIKPYHRTSRWPDGVRPPPGLPAGLAVELAARHDGRTEVYLRRTVDRPWSELATTCAGLVGGAAPSCAPVPRDVPLAHCVSLSWTGDRLTAVTLYATDRCLPDDRAVAAAWQPGLTPVDRRTYEATLGAVRALGRHGHESHHGMLGWTATADGETTRAVSLRVRDPHS